MAGTPSFEAAPANAGPALSINYTTTNALALLVGAPRGTERLVEVKQAARDAHTRLVPHAEIQAAVTEMHESGNRLLRLTGRRTEGNFELPEHDGRVIEAQRLLGEAEAEVARLQRLDAERSPAYAVASRLARRAETEISDKPPGTTWQDHIELVLPKGDLSEHIQRQRSVISAKKLEIERAARTTTTREHAKRHAREQLDAIARPPDLTGLKHGRDIVLPAERLQVQMYNTSGGAVGFTSANDGAGLLAWLFRDQLLQRIDAEVDAMIGTKEGVTPEQREKVIARLEGELMDLERLDVEMTWRQGLQQREDVAIPALLGIRLVTEPVQPSRSSPGHAYDLVGASNPPGLGSFP
jgi:hypothetical protein